MSDNEIGTVHGGELILYQTEDGLTQVGLHAIDHTIWLTPAEMVELFDTSPQAITTQLIKAIYSDGEVEEGATCKEFLQVHQDGGCQMSRKLKLYSLQMILDFWRSNVDRLLDFNEWPILQDSGSISHGSTKSIVHERYEKFDTNRRLAEAEQADIDDLKEQDELESKLLNKGEAR